jgi:endonuclease/exonuclease/phosphatase family metal-dependent hydrolase
MNFRRYIALLLLLVFVVGAIACNKADAGEEGSSTAATTDAATEKATKKPAKDEQQTEPPTVIENTEGLDLDLKLLSQNLSPLDRPNGNSVAERYSRFEVMISELAPDIIATQEGSLDWIKSLKKMEKYSFSGISSNGKRAMSGLWNGILYNKERFVLMDEGDFWVGDNPKSASTTAGAMDKRICTWVELFDRYTGNSLVVASSQLDHACESVRETQAKQLTQALKSALGSRHSKMPIYLAVDLKSDEYGSAYDELIVSRGYADVRDMAKVDNSEVLGTNHFFGNAEQGREESFWFTRTNKSEILSYEIISKKYKGENDTEAGFVSDHYGILIKLGAAS